MLSRLNVPGYVKAALIVAIGGILNGYDTGSIGAATAMPQFTKSMGHISSSILGLTVAMIMLGGAVPAFFAGQLADRFGRLPIIIAGTSLFSIGAVLQAASYSISQFIVGRGIAGIGEGLFLGTANVYVCEIAPSKGRGRLMSATQLLVTVGIVLGYFSCYGSVKIQSDISWRLPFIFQAVLAAVMTTACFRLPPSPRWLVLQGRRPEAMHAIEVLGIQQAEAEKDILRDGQEGAEEELIKSPIEGLMVLFKRQYRSRFMLALFVLGMIQLSGIDGVLFYAPILFAQAGLAEETAGFLASGVSALLILAISIPAVLFADRFNRRTSAIAGGIGLSATMFAIGSLYAAQAVHSTGVGRWFVVVFIFAFALTYSATWAVMGKIYASEIQPAKTRAAANSIAQGLNFFCNALVALITPLFLEHSAFGAYFLYGGLSFCTLIVLYLYMPETRNQPLESISELFQRPLQLQGVLRSFRSSFALSRTDGERTGSIELDDLSVLRSASALETN